MIRLIISKIIISIISVTFASADEAKLPLSQFQTTAGEFQKVLAVRNQMVGIEKRSYQAKFIVHNADHNETYYSEITVVNDEFGKVIFPDDFKYLNGSELFYYRNGGNFIWNCIVDGDVVIDGSFSFSSTEFDNQHDLRELIQK